MFLDLCVDEGVSQELECVTLSTSGSLVGGESES
jgi:hypothetical protein